MRGVYISLAIMFFCLSMQVINEIDNSYFESNNRSIYGWQGQPYRNYSNFGNLAQSNTGDLDGYTTPEEQPSAFSLDSAWALFAFLMSLVSFVVDVLFNSTLGFGKFISTLGGDDIRFIPFGMEVLITFLVNLNHMFAILQIISGKNLNDGA